MVDTICQILTCSPLCQVSAVSRELEDPGVAVAIRDKDVSGLRVHGHVGGLTEVAAVTSWCESFSQCQQCPLSAVAGHLEHLTKEDSLVVWKIVFNGI